MLTLLAQSSVFSRNFPEPIMSAHMTPEQVRSKIDHPIVDGDGHWVMGWTPPDGIYVPK